MDLGAWNERLVAAVFHERYEESPEIRRIDATDGFLADAGEFDDPDRARASFLGAFPHEARRVRSLFEDHVLVGWSSDSKSLPFYAQLHLTVLAASADEEVQDVGDFRRRFSAMLDLPDADYISQGCLPKLWEVTRSWSQRQCEIRGDTRRLLLPDPGYETIIGYSKRLAFPGFRDQNRLAEVLTRGGVDATSAVSRLIGVLRGAIADFSALFREEFLRFQSLIERGDSDAAADTPFWDVVVETSWHRTSRTRNMPVSGCRLEIDPTDPMDLGLWIHCDEACGDVPGWSCLPGDRRPYGLSRCLHDSERSPGRLLELLRELRKTDWTKVLPGAHLGRALADGCVGFVEDDEGQWVDTSSFPETGFLWLVLDSSNYRLLDGPTGVTPSYKVPLPGSREWMLFGPVAANEERRRWFESLAFGVDFFSPRLQRRTIAVVGSIRRPDGAYLYLPPVIPAFRCAGARSGSAELDDGHDRAEYGLCLRDDRLELPDDARAFGGRDLRMNIRAFDAASKPLAERRFAFQNTSGVLEFKPVRSPTSWLESGLGGLLQEFSPEQWPVGEPRSDPEHTPIGRSLPPLRQTTEHLETPVAVDFEEMDERWVRGWEILAAMFARRYAYPLGEVAERFSDLWGSPGGAWNWLDDLVENGTLRRLHARRWSNRVFVAGRPTIVASPKTEGGTVRIVGLTSAAMRALVTSVLGCANRVVASPDRSTFGALEFDYGGANDLDSLRRETGWPVVSLGADTSFAVPSFDIVFSVRARADLDGLQTAEKRVWNLTYGRFVLDESAEHEFPRLEMRRSERLQELFVLHRRDGSVWNTDCRKWALLALSVDSNRDLGQVFADGAIRLEDPHLAMPTAIGWCTVATGGVCYRDSEGRRVYTSGDGWSPSQSCAAWIGARKKSAGAGGLRPRTAGERYAWLLGREKRAANRRH